MPCAAFRNDKPRLSETSGKAKSCVSQKKHSFALKMSTNQAKPTQMKLFRLENLIFLTAWGLLFAAFVLKIHMHTASGTITAPDLIELIVLALVLFVMVFMACTNRKDTPEIPVDNKRLHNIERISTNSLRRIHALTDIAPEKAKHAMWEFSKVMHYVLVEANQPYVHLYYELDFIQHYTALIKLRFGDTLSVGLELPVVPDRQIPPLVLFAIIEDVVSRSTGVDHSAAIEIKASVQDERLQFLCRGTNANRPVGRTDSLGIDDVRQRLDARYGLNYSLDIHDTPEAYAVTLVLPLKMQANSLRNKV